MTKATVANLKANNPEKRYYDRMAKVIEQIEGLKDDLNVLVKEARDAHLDGANIKSSSPGTSRSSSRRRTRRSAACARPPSPSPRTSTTSCSCRSKRAAESGRRRFQRGRRCHSALKTRFGCSGGSACCSATASSAGQRAAPRCASSDAARPDDPFARNPRAEPRKRADHPARRVTAAPALSGRSPRRTRAALRQVRRVVLVSPTGCHAPGTPILMFDGTIRPVESIAVGDELMGPDSRSRTVREVHSGRAPMVEVLPIKGDPFVVNDGHILTLVQTPEGNGHAYAKPGGRWSDISVAELRRQSAYFRHLHKLYRVGVDFPPAPEPPLSPYLLGLLLGDGNLKPVVSITTPDAEIVEVVYREAARLGAGIRPQQLAHNEANTYHFVTPRGQPNPVIDRLRALGLLARRSADKSIPRAYKTGSRSTRAAILAGLLDTDGYMHCGGFEFSSASVRLAEDVAFLARSLGLRALRRAKLVNGVTYHLVKFRRRYDEPGAVCRSQGALATPAEKGRAADRLYPARCRAGRTCRVRRRWRSPLPPRRFHRHPQQRQDGDRRPYGGGDRPPPALRLVRCPPPRAPGRRPARPSPRSPSRMA